MRVSSLKEQRPDKRIVEQGLEIWTSACCKCTQYAEIVLCISGRQIVNFHGWTYERETVHPEESGKGSPRVHLERRYTKTAEHSLKKHGEETGPSLAVIQ